MSQQDDTGSGIEQTLISAFRNGELNQAEFVEKMAYKMLPSKIQRLYYTVALLLWLVVFLSTLGYLIYQLFSLLASYHRYPFKTVNKVVPQLSIPYPVVTLCDLNQVDSLKVDNSARARAFRLKDENISYSGAVKDIFRVAHSKYWRRFSNTSLEDYRLQHLHGTILNMRYQDFMEMSARTVEEAFKMCLWNGQSINCSHYISRVFMEGQICFQFNGVLGGGRVVNRSGFSGGFQAVFTVNIAGHTHSLNSDSGYKLILHDDPRFMHYSAATLVLSPGFLHHVNLQKHTYSFLPRPFKAFGDQYCQDPPRTLRLTTDETYTMESCMFRKIEKKTSRICDCDDNNCTVDQHLTCYRPTMFRIYSEEGVTNERLGCPRPCQMQDYQAQVSLSYFPTDADELPVRELDPSLGSYDVRKSYLGLRLNYKDMILRVSEHVPEQDTRTLFGVIGGNMGLFLGSSLLTLVEVVDFVVILIYNLSVGKRPHRGEQDTEQRVDSVFVASSDMNAGQPQITPVIRTR